MRVHRPAETRPALVADFFAGHLAGEYRDSSRFGVVTFPVGDNVTPVSFSTSGAFIFSHAAHTEACYRWLREITRHPELAGAMPAYNSVIADPATQAVHGESAVQTFTRLAALMNAPNRLFIWPYGLGIGEQMFLARAFDRYVLEGADLAAELALAQELTEAYRACVQNQDVLDCLLQADPTIRDNIEPRILGDR